MKLLKLTHALIFGMLFSVAAATAGTLVEDSDWKDDAMNALFANADVVLKANEMVQSGQPVFGAIEHRFVKEIPTDESNPYPVRIEEFVFAINASFGDAYSRVGKLTITKATMLSPRSPVSEYWTKLEHFPRGR
jgi:hypothetical protein